MEKTTPEGRIIGKWKRVGKDLVMKGRFNGKKMSFFVPNGDTQELVVAEAKAAAPFRAKGKGKKQ